MSERVPHDKWASWHHGLITPPMAEQVYKSFPICAGGDVCDGDLVGEEHEKECPRFGMEAGSSGPTMGEALDEMALRVFKDTRERAARIAADAIAPNRRDIAEAIRAMQPDK